MATDSKTLVAAIGAVATVVAAAVANWDKFAGKAKDEGSGGYRPTGVYETELRIFMELSGGRHMLESMNEQLMQQYRLNAIQESPERAAQINELFKTISQETLTFEEIARQVIPVYQKYFSIEQIQALNRFYSTPLMQDMVSKMQALTVEAAPIQFAMLKENQAKVAEAVQRKLQAMNAPALPDAA